MTHTDGTARRRSTHSQRRASVEILRDDGGSRQVQAPKAETSHQCLREEDLPVSGGDTREKHPDNQQPGADPKEPAEMAGIEEGTGGERDEEKKEGLCRPYPGDGRRRAAVQHVQLVERLKGAIRVH